MPQQPALPQTPFAFCHIQRVKAFWRAAACRPPWSQHLGHESQGAVRGSALRQSAHVGVTLPLCKQHAGNPGCSSATNTEAALQFDQPHMAWPALPPEDLASLLDGGRTGVAPQQEASQGGSTSSQRRLRQPRLPANLNPLCTQVLAGMKAAKLLDPGERVLVAVSGSYVSEHHVPSKLPRPGS